MDMIKVETTGAFGLFDPASGYEIPHDRPVPVPRTHFITERLEIEQLREVHPLDHDGDGKPGGSLPKSRRKPA